MKNRRIFIYSAICFFICPSVSYGDDANLPLNNSDDANVPLNYYANLFLNDGIDADLPLSDSDNSDLPLNNSDNTDLPLNNSDNTDLPLNSSDDANLPLSDSDDNSDLPLNNSDSADLPLNSSDDANLPLSDSDNSDLPLNDSDNANLSLNSSDDANVPLNYYANLPLNDSDNANLPLNNSDNTDLPLNSSDDANLPLSDSDELEFNTEFLRDKSDNISIKSLIHGYALRPGIYDSSIYINNKYIDNDAIELYVNESDKIEPCIDEKFIKKHDIKLGDSYLKEDGKKCYDLLKIPFAEVKFDSSNQSLRLSLPKDNLIHRPRGYIAPEYIDQGINTLLLNYSANANYYSANSSNDSYYGNLSLNGGFNFGPWRYRNSSYLTKSYSNDAIWKSVSNKIERDFHTSIPTRLEIGDSNTNSNALVGFSFRGIQFSSDDIQLPSSQRNYAPIIRGVANTNAVVEIWQNGYMIHSENVSPGVFSIDDLYSVSSGELIVKILESNGQVQTFTQNYSFVPNLIRPNQYKFQLTAGKYRSGYNLSDNSLFLQYTNSYGLNSYLTPYSGIIFADNYYSVAAGLAVSLGNMGGISTDVTYSHNKTKNYGKERGLSYTVLYSKRLETTGTDINIAGYRYSTRGYYSFADAVQERNSPNLRGSSISDPYFSTPSHLNKRNQVSVTMSQNFDKYGQFSFNLSKTDFWIKKYNQESLQFSYTNNIIDKLFYNFFFQRNKYSLKESEYMFGLNLSFNLGSNSVSTEYRYSDIYKNYYNASISNSFLDDNKLNAQINIAKQDNYETLGLNASYNGSIFNASTGFNYSEGNKQLYGSINGGVLINSNDGVIFGRQMYGNPILIEAKGAKGVRILNQQGLKINDSGYAIVNSSSAYSKNTVSLNVNDFGSNIAIDNPIIKNLVPTKNAVLKAKFDVKNGVSVLANIKYNDKELPIGASILKKENDEVMGLVGLNGQAYLSGVESRNRLVAKWGEESFEKCEFTLPELEILDFGYDEIDINCDEI